MAELSRRLVIGQGALVVSGFTGLCLPPTQVLAAKRSGFSLSEQYQVRLRVQAKKLHDNGRLFVMLLGKFDGDDHFNDDIITWGPFGNQQGVVRPIYLKAGRFEIRADGGFIQYSASIEGRSVREKNKQRTEYRTLASVSGIIRGKG